MRVRGILVAFALAVGSAPADASSWRSRFLDEALAPRPTQWTADFHAYFRDSYTVDKLELARLLPGRAAQRGKRLRALLILGPAGFLWTYWVWTFVDEGDAVRVTIITMPHGRITGKATALISRSAVDRLAERLASAGVEQARSLETIERAAARHSHDGSAEWGFQLLFVQWMETRRLLHARIDPGGDDEAIDVASEAFDSFDLQRTYVHGDRDLSPPEKPRHSGELRLALALAHAGRSELDTALARRGYSSATTIELGLALGMDVVLDRWRFGYDVGFSLPRDAYGRSDQSAVTLRRHGITAHAGYDVVETQNLSVFPFVGLGWNGFELEVDAATSPIGLRGPVALFALGIGNAPF
jgi:hypothetical protein